MNVEQYIQMLPVQLIEALLAHDFFRAANIKRQKTEIESWARMNSFESKYTMEETDEDPNSGT